MLLRRTVVVIALLSSVVAVRAQAAPIKAAYFYSYMSRSHLDSLAAAGFNRALIKDINDSLTTRSRAEFRQWFDLGSRLGIAVVPSWALQAPARMGVTQPGRRYTWGPGIIETGVGCPLDSAFWQSAFLDRGREILRAFPGLDRLHVDLEIYTGSRPHYDRGSCLCGFCRNEYAAYSARTASPARLSFDAWEESRTTTILTALLGRFAAETRGIEISFFDLDRDSFVHRAMARALDATRVKTANYTERTYTSAAGGIAAARQALDAIGVNVPLIAGLSLRRFTPNDLATAAKAVLGQADGCFIFTTYSLWKDPAQLTGPYIVPGAQPDYWAALASAFVRPDLEPSDVRIEPATVRPDTSVEFRFTIHNRGSAAPASRWVLSASGVTLASGNVAVPARDSVEILTALVPRLAVGPHTVRLTADSLGQVAELDESNNARVRTLTIHPPLPVPPVTSLAFPATPVVDDFNRSSGPLGGAWTGTTLVVISSSRFKPGSAAYIAAIWDGAVAGAGQEAYVTLPDLTRSDTARQGLLLKVQGRTVDAGAIEVRYDYAQKRVWVSTLTPGHPWEIRGFVPVAKITDDDEFGARALADGTVEVYRNRVKIGSVSVAGWAFAGLGGRIGLTLLNATSTRFDDFGGGTIGGGDAPALTAANRPPIARIAATPTTGMAPLPVRFSSSGSSDPDGGALRFEWNFGDGTSSTSSGPSHTYAAGNHNAVLTVTDVRGGQSRDSVMIRVGASSRFPSALLIDDFNRSSGPLGGSWAGNTDGVVISSSRFKPTTSRTLALVWNGPGLDADQEAYVTFKSIAKSPRQGLLLKMQGSSPEAGAIEVRYDYAQKKVFVATFTPGRGREDSGPGVSVKLSSGDVFGARAFANGAVEVYRDNARIGTWSVAGWEHAAHGGRIGLTLENAASARFDDFGGGSLPNANQPTMNPLFSPGAAGAFSASGIVELAGGFPNPFRNDVEIRFALPAHAPVRLEVYDVLGRRVTTLASGTRNAGWHSVRWDGRDAHGAPVSAGVFLVRLEAGGSSRIRKLVLAR